MNTAKIILYPLLCLSLLPSLLFSQEDWADEFAVTMMLTRTWMPIKIDFESGVSSIIKNPESLRLELKANGTLLQYENGIPSPGIWIYNNDTRCLDVSLSQNNSINTVRYILQEINDIRFTAFSPGVCGGKAKMVFEPYQPRPTQP